MYHAATTAYIELTLFIIAFIIGQTKVPEESVFPVKITIKQNKIVGCVIIPSTVKIQENLQYAEIGIKTFPKSDTCKITRVKDLQTSKWIYINLDNIHEFSVNNKDSFYARFTIYRYTFINCLNKLHYHLKRDAAER